MFDYVIGFDADTKKCGLVIANVNTKEVLETYNEHILEICEIILPDLVQRFATPTRFINVRIEMPTLQTAVGVNRHYESKLIFASGVFDSGRCSEVANIFKAKCLELGLVYSVVKSSSRVRCDYGNTAAFDIKQLKNFAKNQKKGEKYLSKVSNQKARELFPNMKIVNSETVDAALLIPELL